MGGMIKIVLMPTRFFLACAADLLFGKPECTYVSRTSQNDEGEWF